MIHTARIISFIDNRDTIILYAKKTLVSKQYEYLFFTVLQSTLHIWRISTADCEMWNIGQDISNYSLLQSIALTRNCSPLR